MSATEPLATYLELRESTPEGSETAGLSHSSKGLVMLHVLELASHGEPRGAVALIHDAGEHGGRYLALAHALAREHWAVALPDLRGHGRSEGERGHTHGLREIVRDLESVQDHVAYRLPDAPKVLVGMGLGALWALAYALEKPGSLAALALCGPLWKPAFEVPKPSGGLLKVFKKVGPTAPGRAGFEAAMLTADGAEQAVWKADELVHGIVTVRAAEEAARTAQSCAPRLSELEIPTLVLHGARDPLSDPAESQRRAGGRVEVRVLDGLLHDLFHDRENERAVAELTGFLARAVSS